jgi:hypothetical protein
MPYPLAHPAAVLPLLGPLRRWTVPSALVIGSIVPDLWYFVPLATRETSHGAAGLIVFCLPAGMLLYAVFHLVLKRPLLALLPSRLAPFAQARLPARPWHAVALGLALGAATHLAWDAFTHEEGFGVQSLPALQTLVFASGSYPLHVFQLLQHASTLAGSAFVAGWTWRAFKRLPAPAGRALLPLKTRLLILAGLAAAAAGWAALDAALPGTLDACSARALLRGAGLDAVQALAVALLAYCLATTWLLGRSRAPRSPAGR